MRVMPVQCERVAPSMTAPDFPFAGLLIAHDASPSDAARLAELARTVADAGASPVVVALPPDVAAPPGARVVRTRAPARRSRRSGSAWRSSRIRSRAPRCSCRCARTGLSLVTLLALVDAAKRDEQALIALANEGLDESAVLVPRDAWLDLVTVGESGMDAVAARRRVVRVSAEGS